MKSFFRLCLAILLAGPGVQLASAQIPGGGPGMERAGTWEAYGGLRFNFGENVDFDGGSTIDTDDELAFGFGFGYNFSERLLIGGDMSFGTVDYDGTVQSADVPGLTGTISGEFDTLSISVNGTWHFMDGPLTPFVSANLGYTSVDTNIAEGPPEIGCWWDPWYGQICTTFVDTKTEDAFSYGLGVGGRWDFAPGWFARLSYEERWVDIGKASGTPSFGGLRLDIGSKF
ncbi:MAG: porin family protein [Chromatiales bacterium]|nr:porin family protein [Chromatiales bacterium]